MAKLRANGRWTVPGASGTAAEGWKVYAYIAGTSTPKDTYTTYTEGAANTNPVILDSRGEATIYWSGIYKVVVKDADDVTIWTEDNYGGGEDVIQTGNYNLVKNGSFETDSIASGEPDDWTIVDYTDGVHSLDATDQFHGLNSLKFVSVGTGGGYATSEYFEVEEAKPLNFDWNMKSSVADVRNVVDVLWYTAAKTLISTTNLYDDSTTNVTSWSAKNSQATPPSTARYAQLRIYGCHSSDATSGSTWYDNIEVAGNLARKHTVNTFTQTQTWSKGADVASAGSLTVGSDGNYFDITGTTAITAITTKGIGTVVKLHFDGILTLTHNATNLHLPGEANITTAAGDEAEFVEYLTGLWRCTNYLSADGHIIIATDAETLTGTDATKSPSTASLKSVLGLTRLEENLSFTGQTTVDFDTVFSDHSYPAYRIIATYGTENAQAGIHAIRITDDSGSTFEAATYTNAGNGYDSAGAVVNWNDAAGTGTYVQLSESIANLNGTLVVDLTIYNDTVNKSFHITGEALHWVGSTALNTITIAGYWSGSVAVTGFQLLNTNGSAEIGGNCMVYGIG